MLIFSMANGLTPSSDPLFLLKSASVSPTVSSEFQKKKLNYAKVRGTTDLLKNKRKNKRSKGIWSLRTNMHTLV